MNLLFFFWFALLPLPESSFDQDNGLGNRIVVSFHGADIEPSGLSHEQIQILIDANISLAEISGTHHPGRLLEYGFQFLLAAPNRYALPYQLANTSNRAEEIITTYRNSAIPSERIAAISLFHDPHDQTTSFINHARAIADSLQPVLQKPFYYQSAFRQSGELPGGFSFVSTAFFSGDDAENIESQVVHFIPGSSARQDLSSLEQLMNQLIRFDESILILPAGWLLDRLSHQPEIAMVLNSHTNGNVAMLPLPAATTQLPSANWAVIILVLLWGSFAVHYRYQPSYPSLIMRYLFNHSFYVADIMESRFRLSAPALVILGQHAVITGLVLFASIPIFFSDLGVNALAHSFPYIMIFPTFEFSILFWGIIAGLLLTLISLCWIYFLNKSLKHPSQVINLFCWPLSINLLTATAVVYVAQAGVGTVSGAVALGVFVLIWFMSFNTASIDAARYLEKYRFLNLLLTVGLNIILLAILVTGFFFTPQLFEPLLFALSLP